MPQLEADVISKLSLWVQFFRYMFGDEEGYMCLASTKSLSPKSNEDFKQTFYEWPIQAREVGAWIQERSQTRNVYFCTSLLSKQERKKELCMPGYIVWADLDFVPPNELDNTISASCVLETSFKKYQAFWRLSEVTDPNVIEDFARKITYATGADKGGWGLTKLMRIPHTINFKYVEQPEITVASISAELIDRQLFVDLPDPLIPKAPTGGDADSNGSTPKLDEPMPDLEDLPNTQNITYAYRNEIRRVEGFMELYAGEPDANADWSKRLWRLINICIEVGMDKTETFAVAYEARCNKYQRDNRPTEYLWREVLKAWLNQKHVAIMLDREIIELTMPTLVSRDVEEDSFIKEYKEWGEAVTDAPPQYHELCCFMALSSLISGGLTIETSFGEIHPHLWGLVLGESTLTRKTTCMRMAMDIVTSLDEELILAHDGSPEGILTQISLRPRKVSIFFRDEVSGLFESFNKKDYMAGLSETFTLLYDVPKHLHRALRKETITVSEPYFIFFGGGIRDKVFSLLTDNYVLGGFIPRFLVVSGENDISRLKPIGPPTAGTEALKNRVINSMAELKVNYNLTTSFQAGGQPISMPFTVTARLTQDAWAYSAECEHLLRTAALASPISDMALPSFERMSVSLLKMSTLIAASRREYIDSELVVEKRDLEQAAWYVQRWGKYTIELISQAGKPSTERVIERVFRMIVREPGVLKSDLMRRHHLSSRELRDILDTLLGRGMVEEKKIAQGTRYYIV